MHPGHWFAVGLLIAVGPPARSDEMLAAHEATLRAAGQKVDGPALVTFFRTRTRSPQELARLAALVRQLGADDFARREQASQELLKAGRRSAPLRGGGLRVLTKTANPLGRREFGQRIVALPNPLQRLPLAPHLSILVGHHLVPLPNGHFLMPRLRTNSVTEIDRDGEIVRDVPASGAATVALLPNGNLLVGSQGTHSPATNTVREIGREGKVLSTLTVPGHVVRVRVL